jgi:Protein of unknown function (DUF1569)
MVARRTLKFATLDEVVRDAEHLLASGYDRTGNWSLAECCGHLVYWLTAPLDGYGRTPLFVKPILWIMRNTIGPGQLRGILANGFSPGGMTDPQSVMPANGTNDAEAVERLLRAVERFQHHAGPIVPSPVFGPMDNATALQLQLVHCAHHLSFLVPMSG